MNPRVPALLAAVATLAACAGAEPLRCESEADCPEGRVCKAGRCAPPEVAGDDCVAAQCGPGTVCAGGVCVIEDCPARDCPAGFVCSEDLCVAVSCARMECPAGEACAAGGCYSTSCGDRSCAGDVCIGQDCEQRSCVGVTCPAGEACANGACWPVACEAPCAEGEVCADGACVEGHCVGVACDPDEGCARGACLPLVCLGQTCGPADVCQAGACVLAACVGVECAPDERCSRAGCLPADCGGQACEPGRVCEDGTCVEVACAGVPCPVGEACAAGVCAVRTTACPPAELDQPCTVGVGSCAAIATTICDAAGAVVCGAAAGASGPEVCGDADDQDCDGLDDASDPDCAAGGLPAPRPFFPWNGFTTGSPWSTAPGPAAQPLRPRFRWEPVAGAVQYRVRIDDSCPIEGFAGCAMPSPEIDELVAPAEYTPPGPLPVSATPPVGRRYFWRVSACDASGCGASSAVRYLDVGRLADDFDGDGYSDLLVGAPGTDLAGTGEGVVLVHRGSAGGLEPVAARVLPGTFQSQQLGTVVSALGDVNADGFADAGAAGGLYQVDFALYLGSASGLPDSATQTVRVPVRPTDTYGVGLTGAGDQDGDGRADVLAAGREINFGQMEVKGFLFAGAEGGVGAAPALSLTRAAISGSAPVAPAGDMDGDGIPEFAIGVPSSADGFVRIYEGALDPAPAWTLPSPPSLSGFGRALAAAGDVDGDGLAELAVGATGAAFLLPGAAGATPPALRPLEPGAGSSSYGFVLAAPGDADGDGLSDVAVVDLAASGGRADLILLYDLSSSGVGLVFPAITDGVVPLTRGAGAGGDFDGDGLGELVVGLEELNAGQGAFLYFDPPASAAITYGCGGAALSCERLGAAMD